MFDLRQDHEAHQPAASMRSVLSLLCLLSVLGVSFGKDNAIPWRPDAIRKWSPIFCQESDDTWMGIYIQGIKVGHQHKREHRFVRAGREWITSTSESRVRISRLGGAPVEIVTVLETTTDTENHPRSLRMQTNMAGTALDVSVEITNGEIRFTTGNEEIKTREFREDFYLSVPIEKIIRERGMRSGRRFDFQILDPLAHDLTPCSFDVIGKEDVLLLGRVRCLWHTRTDMTSIVPISIEEWIDDEGRVWKEISRSGFLSTTSIRMSRERALEPSSENFDIAFSSMLKSNVMFRDPQRIRRAEFKLGGVSLEKIRDFPYEDGSQRILEEAEDHVLIETTAVIFAERNSLNRPIVAPEWSEYLKTTPLVAWDKPVISETALGIINGETNAWAAAKRIARWVDTNMTPAYDIGFAGAEETLRIKRGDCSEYTVLTVALCRAVGIPARAAVGVMYGQGIFAYHMWAEVYVGRWVGLDSKWLAEAENGEVFTDATHIKFGHSALDTGIFKELGGAIAEIIGLLTLEVKAYSPKN